MMRTCPLSLSQTALSWVAAATLASVALAGPPRGRFADPSAPDHGVGVSQIAAAAHRTVASVRKASGHGRSARGAWLGVWLAPLSDSQRERLGGGARVVAVAEDSPADHAGLRRSDIIVRINDRRVRSPQEVRQIVRTLRPGREARLRIVRGSRVRTVRIRPAERPAADIHPRRESEDLRDEDDSEVRTDEASEDESDDRFADIEAEAEEIETAFERLARTIAATAEEIENEDDPMVQVAMTAELLRRVSDMLDLVPMVEEWVGATLDEVDTELEDAGIPGMDWARSVWPNLRLFRNGSSPDRDATDVPSPARSSGRCRCDCGCCRQGHDKASRPAERSRRSRYDETD